MCMRDANDIVTTRLLHEYYKGLWLHVRPAQHIPAEVDDDLELVAVNLLGVSPHVGKTLDDILGLFQRRI